MEFIFFDNDPHLVDVYQSIIGPGTNDRTHIFMLIDVNDIGSSEHPIDYIVSSANVYQACKGLLTFLESEKIPGEILRVTIPGMVLLHGNLLLKTVLNKYTEH